MSRHGHGQGGNRSGNVPQSPPIRQQTASDAAPVIAPVPPPAPVPEPTRPDQDQAAAASRLRSPSDLLSERAAPHPGWKRCRALRCCLVRGAALFPPAEFWLEPGQAERLRKVGDLEFI